MLGGTVVKLKVGAAASGISEVMKQGYQSSLSRKRKIYKNRLQIVPNI